MAVGKAVQGKGMARKAGVRLSWTAKALAGVGAFVGVGAVAFAVFLLSDTSGANVGLAPSDMLRGPLTDYLVPGLALLFLVGGSTLITAIATLLRWRWAPEAGVLAGIILLGWIVIQVWIIGLTSFLQPMYFVLGMVMVALGLILRQERT